MNGFIDIAALSYVMTATELFSYTGKSSLQTMGFNCFSIVTSWMVGASLMGDRNQNVEQITIEVSQSHIIALDSLNATPYLNVYEYGLDIEILVHRNQYIAVNSTQIYYQRCGLMNEQSGLCVDRPLIVVDAGKYQLLFHDFNHLLRIPCFRLPKQMSQLYSWVHGCE